MIDPTSDCVILFTRYPQPGRAKTRLIPALGAEDAAMFQRKMTEFILAQVKRTGARIEIRYTDGDEDQMRAWLGNDLVYRDQGEGSLGERMHRAFTDNFSAGARRVIITGADCPDNRSRNIKEAFRLLGKHDLVLGPAADGGYYLIGLTQPHRELFEGIDWGTGHVLQQTLAKAQSLSTGLLPTLSDIDEIHDIPPLISVVIPTLNEAPELPLTLAHVRHGFHYEIIVADGNSNDDTCATARQLGVDRIVNLSTPQRARQMNAGARDARGEILLFLHADTQLPEGWDMAIRACCRQRATAQQPWIGAFRFRLRERMWWSRVLEAGVAIRSRFLGRPYGDQALFMRRKDFFAVGAFPEIPILEDLELVSRIRCRGHVVILPLAIETSARRWNRLGFCRTTWLNQKILLGAKLGIAPEELRNAYRQGNLSLFQLLRLAVGRSANRQRRSGKPQHPLPKE